MTTIGHTSKSIDIDCPGTLPISVTFTSDGKEIVSGEDYSNTWGIEGRIRRCPIQGENLDKKERVLVDTTDGVDGAVMSKDGQWIMIIMGNRVVVRNTTTNEGVEVREHASGVRAIDVSPSSTRFASGSEDKTVRVFSITTGQRVLGPLQHEESVVGVKFSPNGDCLATAAHGDPVRVWDARDGTLVLQTNSNYFYNPNGNLTRIPTCTPLGWSSDSQRVFVVAVTPTGIQRQCLGASSFKLNLALLWYQSVPASDDLTPCSLATNGRFIVCSAGHSLSFWDISSKKIGPTIEFQDSILSIALSSDDHYLACGMNDMKITVHALRDILPLLIFDPASRLPLMDTAAMNNDIFQAWIKQQFYEAETSLCREIGINPSPHTLAYRALLRAHMKQQHTTIEFASKSLAIRPTIIGHIAKAVALVGIGQHEPAFEAFDIVFCNCGADETRFLLLIRAILLFVSGKRENAIARVNDLIAVADDSAKYNCLQVLANMYLMQGDPERTIQSFHRAQSLSFSRQGFHLATILLIFGRSFEELEMTVRYPLRGANAA